MNDDPTLLLNLPILNVKPIENVTVVAAFCKIFHIWGLYMCVEAELLLRMLKEKKHCKLY